MIEDALIESARLIKLEFNNLNDVLSGYEEEVRKVANLFIKISEDLKDITKEISKSDTIGDIKKRVMSKMNELEIESEGISSKISNISNKLEKLKKEENDLYVVIKKRYPSMSDDDIKKEIQKRIL